MHNFVGHLHSTVYMSGIPASCSRGNLLLAVSELVHAEFKTDRSAIERLVMAQPTWNNRDGRLVFEKCAWLVLTGEIEDAAKVVVSLRDLKVYLPEPTG